VRTASTDTFSFDVPDVFERVRPAWQSLRASRDVGGDDVDFTVGLTDDDLRKHPGVTPAERFRSAALERRGPTDLLDEAVMTVEGVSACIVTSRAGHGEYVYFFARVDIGGGYFLDAVGDCPAGHEDEHFPYFRQMLASLRWFGDPAAGLAAQREALAQLFADDDDEDEGDKPAAVPPPPFEIPADGADVFTIGEVTFDFLPQPDAQLSPHSTTGSELLVNLRARAHRHEDDLLNDYDHDEVYFNLSLPGVYRAGVPTGEVQFAAGRDVADEAYLWIGGFHYRLSLSAHVVLREGWIGLAGTLDDMDGRPCYPVQLARRLQLDGLDWTRYRFIHLEELDTAPPGLVRHLMLRDLPGPTLPPEVFEHEALETLSVQYRSPAQGRAGITAIPEALAELTALRDLSLVQVTAVREIPEALGRLTSMESLLISGTQAEQLPASVAALPALRRCLLGGNRLRTLPEVFSPSLEHLSLNDNALATVPPTLAGLSRLRSLDLRDNPLVSLPAALVDLPALRLELDKKLVLFDYRYPKGDADRSLDAALFGAPGAETLTAAFAEHLGDPVWAYTHPLLRRLARRAVALATTAPDDYAQRGNTRFGGLPDLPAGMAYPTVQDTDGQARGMQFIAQLDCAALADFQGYLPRTGTLYFFLSDQETRRARVLHHVGEASALQSAADLVIHEDFILDQHGVYAPWRAAAGPWTSLPHLWGDAAYCADGKDTLAALEADPDRMEALRADVDAAGPVWPVHGINSYVFKQHDTPEREAADALRGRPEDFMVLLRVASDGNPGFSFWDAGEIYFVIHKRDLAAQDFSNVYVGLESS